MRRGRVRVRVLFEWNVGAASSSAVGGESVSPSVDGELSQIFTGRICSIIRRCWLDYGSTGGVERVRALGGCSKHVALAPRWQKVVYES